MDYVSNKELTEAIVNYQECTNDRYETELYDVLRKISNSIRKVVNINFDTDEVSRLAVPYALRYDKSKCKEFNFFTSLLLSLARQQITRPGYKGLARKWIRTT